MRKGEGKGDWFTKGQFKRLFFQQTLIILSPRLPRLHVTELLGREVDVCLHATLSRLFCLHSPCSLAFLQWPHGFLSISPLASLLFPKLLPNLATGSCRTWRRLCMNSCQSSAKCRVFWGKKTKRKQRDACAILNKASPEFGELGKCTPLNYKEYVLICMGSICGYQIHWQLHYAQKM